MSEPNAQRLQALSLAMGRPRARKDDSWFCEKCGTGLPKNIKTCTKCNMDYQA